MSLNSYNLSKNSGFSILEIAIALTILAFLSYGVANTIKVGRDYDRFSENREVLLDAKNALLAFVQSNGYLPCPDGDVTIDGIEDRTLGACSFTAGRLPYQTIGVNEFDAWDNYIYYAVPTTADTLANIIDVAQMASYYNSSGAPAPTFNLNTAPLAGGATTGANKVCGENATACNSSTPDADMVELAAVAVLVSFGDAGQKAWSNIGTSSAFSTKEFENADSDNYFWKETGSYNETTGFDDQLVWLTGFDIKYALLRTDIGLSE